jgi:4'-phosphopantetheinyl transferase EntD
MLSNASAIAAVFANSRVVVKPLTGEEGQFQGPPAGPDNSTQRHLVERMEDEGDDWALLKLVHAPTFRPRSRRVRRHPVAVAARLAARLALAAARSAASRAAASATKVAPNMGLSLPHNR